MIASILVVEDNPITNKVFTQSLIAGGYEVHSAHDGKTALELFSKMKPDMILQDIRLSDIDGESLCRRFRSMPGGSTVPIVAVTGLSESEVDLDLFTGFLRKPVGPAEIIQYIASIIVRVPPVRISRRVLVVDDNPGQLRLLATILENIGYEVATAANGEEAMESIRRETPDAVISDVLMPRIDGFGLCSILREDRKLSRIPVILVSNFYTEEEDQRIARSVGAVALVSRTASQHEVLRILQDQLEHGASPNSVSPDEIDLLRSTQHRLDRLTDMTLARERRVAHLESVIAAIAVITEVVDLRVSQAEILEELLPRSIDALGLLNGGIFFRNHDALRIAALSGFDRHESDRLLDMANSADVKRTWTTGERAVVVRSGGASGLERSFIVASFDLGGTLHAGCLVLEITGFDVKCDWRIPAITLSREIGRILFLARTLAEKLQVTENLRQVTDSINEVFWMIDPHCTKTLFISSGYERIWGRPCSELEANPRAWIDAVVPEDRDRVIASLESTIRRNEETLFRIQIPSGAIRWIRTKACPIRNNGGEVVGIAGVSEDITHQRRMEEELRQAQKMEAVGQLAGGVAHDFNNLLSVIIGSTEILTDELPLEDSRREFVTEIRSAADSAASLTRQLLAFGRKQMLAPQRIALCGVVIGLERMLKRLIPESIEIELLLSRDKNEWIHWIHADPAQIEQIIMNLAVNARDAMPRGGRLAINVTHEVVEQEFANLNFSVKAGDYTCLTIADSGVGMDKKTQMRIFEPFFTTKERGQGTGLGLATVHGIVRQSEGYIIVESEPGRGTTFKIFLPRVEPGVIKGIAKLPRVALSGLGETVLLVEDNAGVRRATRRILENGGYKVVEAVDGQDAIRICGQDCAIDLVLTDVVMPNLGGPELARRLKEKSPHLRVLFMSGYAEAGVQKEGLFDGSFDFIEKPFSREGLLVKLRKILERENPLL